MKNLFLVLILVFVGFVSCDGRKSRSEALKSSIAEYNERQSDVVFLSYYPKDYTEVVTDTLLTNNVNVHIKNYSLPNQSILMSINDEGVLINQKQHRVFESDIVISSSSKELLNMNISAEKFKSIYPDEFWNHATLQQVWVNQELSTEKDVKLDMSFINPSNNTYKMFRISIDEDGYQTIILIEENS